MPREAARVVVGHPPQRVQRKRRNNDPRVAPPATTQPQLDKQAQSDRDPEARAGQGHGQQDARERISGAIGAVEREQTPDSGRERDEPRGLKRPKHVGPTRAEEEHKARDKERTDATHSRARIGEHQRDAREIGRDHHHAVRRVVFQAGGGEEHLV